MRLRTIEPILRRAFRGPCRVPGGRVLVAVSGGADSTALLLGLSRLSGELGLELRAAHLHHRLRGPEADGDLAFVQALCSRLSVPFTFARWDTKAHMRRRGLSGQAGLRELRSEFLLSVARKVGSSAIATAHTADDQLETLLLRLGRGTGLRGLGAISPRRGVWIRPLLAASRAQIEADLRKIGQAWREDSSNSDLRYARNRIRHGVVPALVEALAGGGTRSSISRKAAAGLAEVRAASRLVERQAREILEKAISNCPQGQLLLDLDLIGPCPALVRRTILCLAWRRLRTGVGLTAGHLRGLSRLVTSTRDGRVNLPRGKFAWHQDRVLSIGPKPEGIEHSGLPPLTDRLVLRVPGHNPFGIVDLRTKWVPGSRARTRLERKPANEEFFASEALQGVLELRQGHTDERFVPFGSTRSLRLGKLLGKREIHDSPGGRPMVLADSRGILWVIGVRRSARAPVTNETRKALWIHTEHR